MHLHDHAGALAELLAEALAVDLLAAAGRPGAEPRGVVDLGAAAGAGRSCRSRSSPGPACRRPSARPPATRSAGTRNRITWCTTSGLPGSTLKPVMNWSLGDLRVEQEAAVVVGAGAGRSRRRVVLRHPHGDPALARAQRLVPDRGRRVEWPVRRVRRAGRGRRARRLPGRVGVVPVVPQAARTRASTEPTTSERRTARSGADRGPTSGGPRCSSGRPGHGAAAEDVHVGVEDGLVGRGAGVEDQAVALAEALAARRSRRAASNRSTAVSGSPRPASAAFGVVAARDHQDVGGRLRVRGRGTRRWSSDSCTTSASMSPATILQNRQSSPWPSSLMAPACLMTGPACKPPGRPARPTNVNATRLTDRIRGGAHRRRRRNRRGADAAWSGCTTSTTCGWSGSPCCCSVTRVVPRRSCRTPSWRSTGAGTGWRDAERARRTCARRWSTGPARCCATSRSCQAPAARRRRRARRRPRRCCRRRRGGGASTPWRGCRGGSARCSRCATTSTCPKARSPRRWGSAPAR